MSKMSRSHHWHHGRVTWYVLLVPPQVMSTWSPGTRMPKRLHQGFKNGWRRLGTELLGPESFNICCAIKPKICYKGLTSSSRSNGESARRVMQSARFMCEDSWLYSETCSLNISFFQVGFSFDKLALPQESKGACKPITRKLARFKCAKNAARDFYGGSNYRGRLVNISGFMCTFLEFGFWRFLTSVRKLVWPPQLSPRNLSKFQFRF